MSVIDERKKIYVEGEKNHCHLRSESFVAVNKFVMTTVQWWHKPRNNVALLEELLCHQLSSVQKITVLGTSHRTIWVLKCKLRTLSLIEYCYWWKGSWLFENWSHHVCCRFLVLKWGKTQKIRNSVLLFCILKSPGGLQYRHKLYLKIVSLMPPSELFTITSTI